MRTLEKMLLEDELCYKRKAIISPALKIVYLCEQVCQTMLHFTNHVLIHTEDGGHRPTPTASLFHMLNVKIKL